MRKQSGRVFHTCGRLVYRVCRRHHRCQHVILRCQTILAHAVSVNPERSSDVAVAEHLLYSLYVRPFPYEEARQAVPQVVEPEADLLTFLERACLHRSRAEMIFDQHVGDARLLAL